MNATDIAALVVVGGTTAGIIAAAWPRRSPVPPVSRRAMQQLERASSIDAPIERRDTP